ncbi:MAG: PA14 domain-containing protein [bacterium]
MTRSWKVSLPLILICAGMLVTTFKSYAWEPNIPELTAAANSASFGAYAANLGKWLSAKAPTSVRESTMRTVLKDPVVANALCQWAFLVKSGVGGLDAFAKASPGNKAFLLWILQDTRIMDLYLIGATPISIRQREDNSFGLPGGALELWKKIYDADPESRQGLYLRLAMATALNPPGTGCRGAGQPEKQEEPLARYLYLRDAHKKKELFPSFDNLTVWELRQVTCCMASNADMTWGREMVNIWNPDFRKNEGVVDTTTQVWRRNSPISHGSSYKNVLAGGGKCGPRSSWSVFICQAFGIPATGVGQPAHACVAYRMMDGNWRTAFGRSWAASKLLGMSGNEFIEGVGARLQTTRFLLVEHMRWLAATLPATNQGPILELAKYITKAPPIIELPVDRSPTAVTSLKSLEAPKDEGDTYFARVRGYVYPPVSGEYVFGVASDDQADLFLSESDSIEDKKLIAYNREFTDPGKYDTYPTQKSPPIRLEAGKKYYIEAVHKELTGGDHLSVAWKGPGVAGSVVPGVNLSPYPTGEKGSITREVWRSQAAAVVAKATVAPAAPAKAAAPVAPPVPPTFSAVNGVIHVDAASFCADGGVAVFGGHTGVWTVDSYPPSQVNGKQIHFAANMGTVWAGWKINVPETGIYELVAKGSTVNFDQYFFVRSYGATYPVKSATVSAVYHNMVKDLGAEKACDNNPGTRWAVNEGVDKAWLEIDLGEPKTISTCMIDERFFNRINTFKVEYKAGLEWKLLFQTNNIGILFERDFPPVTAQNVRLTTLDGRENGGPTIWEFAVGNARNGSAWLSFPCTYGLWGTTKPADIRLVKGAQTIWFMAPFQRGVSLKSFDLKLKGTSQTAYTPKTVIGGAKSVPSSQLKNNTGEDAE